MGKVECIPHTIGSSWVLFRYMAVVTVCTWMRIPYFLQGSSQSSHHLRKFEPQTVWFSSCWGFLCFVFHFPVVMQSICLASRLLYDLAPALKHLMAYLLVTHAHGVIISWEQNHFCWPHGTGKQMNCIIFTFFFFPFCCGLHYFSSRELEVSSVPQFSIVVPSFPCSLQHSSSSPTKK